MRQFLACLSLSFALAAPAGADGLTDMSADEKAAFGAAVREYLLENPEVLVEAMTVLQDQQAQAEAMADDQLVAHNSAAIFEDGVSWVGGNPDGDITLVEFMDYRCSYCKKAFTEVSELIDTDGNIRFIVKEFPILGDDSILTSRFAIAVQQLHGADAYETVHNKLMELRGTPDNETLTRIAADMGLEPEAIITRMASDEVTQVIAANHALATELAISGTPTFVINGQMLRGYVPLDTMRQIVADERG
jgi:protein-disulfide isomerase